MSSKNITVRMIKEIRKTLYKFLIFQSLLDSIIMLLAVYLIFLLFRIPTLYSLVPAGIFSIANIIYKAKKAGLKEVEEKYAFLNERLRTVEDTLDEDNFMVEELRREVDMKMKKVTESSFLNLKKAYIKTIISSVLCFMIIASTVYGIRIIDASSFAIGISDKIDDVASAIGSAVNFGDDMPGEYVEGSSKKSKNKFGSANTIKLGDETVNIDIESMGDITGMSSTGNGNTNSYYDADPYASSDKSFEEKKMDKEDLNTIKEYFEKITGKK